MFTIIVVFRQYGDDLQVDGSQVMDDDAGGLRQSVRVQEGTEYSSVIDTDITRFETLLDGWQLELKQKIMVCER